MYSRACIHNHDFKSGLSETADLAQLLHGVLNELQISCIIYLQRQGDSHLIYISGHEDELNKIENAMNLARSTAASSENIVNYGNRKGTEAINFLGLTKEWSYINTIVTLANQKYTIEKETPSLCFSFGKPFELAKTPMMEIKKASDGISYLNREMIRREKEIQEKNTEMLQKFQQAKDAQGLEVLKMQQLEFPLLYIYACSINDSLKALTTFEDMLQKTFETLKISGVCFIGKDSGLIAGSHDTLEQVKNIVNKNPPFGTWCKSSYLHKNYPGFLPEWELIGDNCFKAMWKATADNTAPLLFTVHQLSEAQTLDNSEAIEDTSSKRLSI